MSDYIKREDAIFVALQQPLYSVVSQIKQLEGINLDDYVPRDFHDKTCEAMAKRHQEEIADMVSVVRCKKCKYEGRCRKAVEHITHEPTSVTIGCKAVDFCSYGERKNR